MHILDSRADKMLPISILMSSALLSLGLLFRP